MARPRSFVPRLLVRSSLAVLAVVALGRVASAGGSSHPYFDDRGTLTWYERLEDAKAAAKASGKAIFVEYGRLHCGNCRVLVQTVLPNPQVRDRLAKVAVGLASDCDDAEPAVEALFRRNLANAQMLPFGGFLTADGRWITGFSGLVGVGAFQSDLCAAEAYVARCASTRTKEAPNPATKAPPPPAPARKPAPAPPPCDCPGCCCAPPPVKPGPVPPPVVAVVPTPADVVPPPAPAPLTACGNPDEGSAAVAPTLVPTPPAPTLAECVPPTRPRPVVPTRIPDATLSGSPDGGSPDGGSPGGADAPAPVVASAPRTAPLPAPRVRISPPVRVDPSQIPAAREDASLAGRAERAAAQGRWSDALAAVRECVATTDVASAPRIEVVSQRAHAWAHERLDEARGTAVRGETQQALGILESVSREMRGYPEAEEAEQGSLAIHAMEELKYLNPGGPVFAAVKKQNRDHVRGTRWQSLFE